MPWVCSGIAAALTMSLPLVAATPAKKDETLPMLSPAGIKRIQENIKTLEQNIRDAQANLQTCDKNLKVLHTEMEQISSLDKEHQELRQKLSAYLDSAHKLMQKNAQEMVKLNKTIKEVESTGGKSEGDLARREKALDRLRQDSSDLDRWKGDAEDKIKRIHEMIREVATGLGDLNSRRNNLKADIDSWNRRKNEYDKLLVHYRQKKAESEAMAKASAGR